MKTLLWMRLLWVVGGLALVLGAARERILQPRVVRVEAKGIPWVGAGFEPNAVYPATVRGILPDGIAAIGSYIESDAWQGDAATAWLTAPPGAVRVAVAGYPQLRGCALRAEFRHRDGHFSTLACQIPDPRERWEPWDFFIPPTAAALRLVAEDHTGANTGWLGFSRPYVPDSLFEHSLFQAAQVLTTLALALTLVWLPGLMLAPLAGSPALRTAIVLATGPLGLALIGLLLWLAGAWVLPGNLGPILGWTAWIMIGVGLWHRRFAPKPGSASGQLLAIIALGSLAATAKATYSGGPEGELFAGTICRTLAVGNRSDARIAFSTSQAIERRLPPTSPEVEQYFTPWTFFSRGPLAGLAAAPVVFATGGRPPLAATDTVRWTPFDVTGFAAYRITLITLSGLVLFALFAALEGFVGETWALVGAALVALCPFVVHELSFTWPKLVATAWLLASFLLVHQRRPFLGGLALGVGYLFHPLALLWTPWLALWAMAREDRHWRNLLQRGFAFAAGTALLAGPWMALGYLPHHLETTDLAGQAGFIRYFVLADWRPATLETWLQTRWMNFSNTFLPLWLHFVYEWHLDINSAYTPAGPLVKFAFSWWNTLPLGLGLLTWATCMLALLRAARSLQTGIILLFVAPSLLLTVYWGSAPTGLMRECGHPLLIAAVGLAIVGLARTRGLLTSLLTHRAAPWCQLPETFLMLWLTTVANPTPPAVDLKSLDPAWFGLNLAALSAIAILAARARANLPSPPVASAS